MNDSQNGICRLMDWWLNVTHQWLHGSVTIISCDALILHWHWHPCSIKKKCNYTNETQPIKSLQLITCSWMEEPSTAMIHSSQKQEGFWWEGESELTLIPFPTSSQGSAKGNNSNAQSVNLAISIPQKLLAICNLTLICWPATYHRNWCPCWVSMAIHVNLTSCCRPLINIDNGTHVV